jgi:integrase
VEELIDTNPFAGLAVEREDGDEDDGFQEEWYLDVTEQTRLFNVWDTLTTLDARDRLEKWMYGLALWTGLRIGELWCLHLVDVHVDGPDPHIVVRYGSWDPEKLRYRSPKGRKGEKKKRVVPLWGLGLESAIRWLEVREAYLKMTPKTAKARAANDYQDLRLMFPTERGRRRDNKPPRSWKKVIDAFGVVARIGGKPWWHLLRHSCASSLISGAWGDRWTLEDVQKVLGHADIRTTQMYAHLAPSALQATATRAQASFTLAKVIPISRHAAVTALRDDRGEAGKTGHAREDSNLRPTAPEAVALSS